MRSREYTFDVTFARTADDVTERHKVTALTTVEAFAAILKLVEQSTAAPSGSLRRIWLVDIY